MEHEDRAHLEKQIGEAERLEELMRTYATNALNEGKYEEVKQYVAKAAMYAADVKALKTRQQVRPCLFGLETRSSCGRNWARVSPAFHLLSRDNQHWWLEREDQGPTTEAELEELRDGLNRLTGYVVVKPEHASARRPWEPWWRDGTRDSRQP